MDIVLVGEGRRGALEVVGKSSERDFQVNGVGSWSCR